MVSGSTAEQQISALLEELTRQQSVQTEFAGQVQDLIERLSQTDERTKKLEVSVQTMKTTTGRAIDELRKRPANGQTTADEERYTFKDRLKMARDVKPNKWGGTDQDRTFFKYRAEVREWGRALNERFKFALIWSEKQETDADWKLDALNEAVPDRDGIRWETVIKEMYRLLETTIEEGTAAKSCVQPDRATDMGCGFETWNLLPRRFDPRSGVAQSVAYAKVIMPAEYLPEAVTCDQGIDNLQTWERDIAECEMRYADSESPKICDMTKMAQSKLIVPEFMFSTTGPFR